MPSCPALHPVYIFPFMPQAITPVSFACILIGVLLNASAQLLLKAGVNAVGAFAFTRANIVPVGLKLIAQIPVIAGRCVHCLSDALARLCRECSARCAFLWRSVDAATFGGDIDHSAWRLCPG